MIAATGKPSDYATSGHAIIELPFTPDQLPNLNDRGASKGAAIAKGIKVADIRGDVVTLLRQAELPKNVGFVRVQMHYQPATVRGRDADNLLGAGKPIYDAFTKGREARIVRKRGKIHQVPALVGYGMVADDQPQYMDKPTPILEQVQPGKPARLWLTITWGPVKPPTATETLTTEMAALARLALLGDTTQVGVYLTRAAHRHRHWYPQLSQQLTGLLTAAGITGSPLRDTDDPAATGATGATGRDCAP
ncbi:hypothetical protein [Nocardia asiatica]|uniref:hypothetical protein n=1 Tax=Nocardia asiatica TaxID=209252 RepID=UPI0002D8AAE8|nr:hypothetical protein [Nocardia asiatica]